MNQQHVRASACNEVTEMHTSGAYINDNSLHTVQFHPSMFTHVKAFLLALSVMK